MKFYRIRFLLWSSIVCLLVCLAATRAEPGLLVESYDLQGYPKISLRLSAWDLEGLPLVTLDEDNFTIRENQGSPIQPDQVVIDRDAPLSVILVLDTSGSMQGQALIDAKTAAARFLDRLSPGDQAALIAFSDAVNPDPNVLADGRELALTNNLVPMYDLVEGLTAQGGTHLYNALVKAVGMAEALPSGHRAILLLSDGVNEPADVGEPGAPISLPQENNLPIYVIGLGDRIDEPYLRRLASDTGGVFRLAPRSSELAQTFNDMADLLKTQYTLTYTSQAAAAGVKAIDLEVTMKVLDSEVSQALRLENLPLMPTQTPLPMPTITPLPPTPIPTAVVIVPVATPQPPTGLQALLALMPWYAWMGILLLLLAGLLIFLLRVLRRSREVEKCANCGYILKNSEGPCLQCGDTRRIKVKSRSKQGY